MKCISISNQKGGVGKTTSAINIAFALSRKSLKVLLIDLDPQGNASTGISILPDKRKISVYDVFLNNADPMSAIFNPYKEFSNFFLLPSSVDLVAIEGEISSLEDKHFFLKKKMQSCASNFDYIIIDCPPSLGLLTTNAFAFSDCVIIPIQCEFFALEGLTQLLNTMQRIRKNINKLLRVAGILLTMYDKRNSLSSQVELDIRKTMGDAVYNSVIPRNVRLPESQSYGEPIQMYDPRSSGAKAYEMFVDEMLEKVKIFEGITR